jgi:putative DNA methylase
MHPECKFKSNPFFRAEKRYFALTVNPDWEARRVGFSVVHSNSLTEKQAMADFGFNPATIGSSRGNATCPFCGSTVRSDHVKAEGHAGRINIQPMALVCTRPGERGKVYLAANDVPSDMWPVDDAIRTRIECFCSETGLTVPEELIFSGDSRAFFTHLYGLTSFGDLFTPRQMLTMLTFAKYIHSSYEAMLSKGTTPGQAKAVVTYLALALNRLSDQISTLVTWLPTLEAISHTFTRQALPMVWDFVEPNPVGNAGGSWSGAVSWVAAVVENIASSGNPSIVSRGTATNLPYSNEFFDAIVTDPPYYDNVPYADLSDYFYVWLKRSLGSLYPEHLSGMLTPKKSETVADPTRYRGDKQAARIAYEEAMLQAFREAWRVLKPAAPLVAIYAHKTTAGWTTAVNALRRAGFTISEAWPLSTERSVRLRAMASAALASSIFLVAQRREGEMVGDYVRDVRPQLAEIVRERVETLMAEGISGADLVIATVGAGLRAYTQYARVELASGQELDAAAYLDEVQQEVAEVILEKVMGVDQRGVGGVDFRTRYYILGRYQYGPAQVPFDEANVLARGVGVELDAPGGLTSGRNPLVEKKKDKVRLRDYRERGEDEDMGLPHNGAKAPLIDVLHRLLWLAEHAPLEVPQFLTLAQPDAAQLRLVAQALAGRALAAEPTPGAMRDTRSAEQGAIDRLLAAWKRVVEENLFVRGA